ncbi:diguanylate cyclase [Rhodoferax ferrireducens T118]|uniref:diguanylate cyclase n=1 Tax=Albidiferax ferrireducens (strain ATCC BAA-621 / DSM 15236 / T118) TaxID=338969 RepID=Q21YG4_ALBFT|nr:diguanylate cyclase [Rhodoferax ferrireducens]ABD69189.1 diguanylate cyclase [Rhodoferax ferrireducens T118]
MNLKAVVLCGLTCVLGLLAPALHASPSSADASFPVFEVSAQTPGRIDVDTRMGMLTDSTRTLTPDQVMSPKQTWQTITRKSPNFGFTEDAYWFRFQIDNLASQDLARFVELPIPFLDDVQLYHYTAGQLKTSYALGDEKPFAQRVLRHQNFVMPLNLAPGANLIYIRLASSGTIEAPFRIWDPTQFYETNGNEKLLQGMVIGILLIMIVYNLFVYFSTRDINYLFYIGFVASYLLFHLTLNGYTFAYAWPNAVRWNSFAISTFMASAELFTCLFADGFLRLSKFSRPAHYLTRALATVSALLLALTFVLPYSLTVRVGAALTIPIALTALALGYWRWWRGAKFARFYCLAWTTVLISLCVLNASKFGLIPSNAWTHNASQIGIVLLVLLLSFTLADRINHDRMLRVNAQAVALGHERWARASQEALIKTKEDANRELEQRVTARTNDLNRTLGQLKLANDQLQRLSNMDGLTQIGNRAFFDRALALEHRRADRQKSPLSLIMIDVDHFKLVNDSYGHMGGDACLRAVAHLLQPRIQRVGDVLARYGGEEFVILLVNSNQQDSVALAEGFRADIEQLHVPFEGGTIHVTASFGVACGIPDQYLSPQELLAHADKALYQAKHDGRNCVRSVATINRVS